MKLKILAGLAVTAAALFFGSPLAFAGGGSPGPQDHTWTVQFSTTAANSHPDVDVTLTLGTNTAATAPFPTAFFDEATTLYAGLTPVAANVGAQVGNINFSIESNVNPGLLASNNLAANGQPPACGSAGSLGLGPVNAPIFAAVKSVAASDPPFNTPSFATAAANPSGPQPGVSSSGSPFPQDQSPDTAHGGVPLGVRNVPDWWVPVLVGIGAPESVITARNYAIAATTAATHTSVNFLTINPGGGVYINVTILANPIAAFSPTGQGIVTCPPFTSVVHQQGVSTARTWDCTADYFNNPVASCGGTTVAGSTNTTTVAAAGGPFPYQISLSSGANLDNDANGSGVPLFGSWDNCDLVANPTQSDANNNGIGDACKNGTGWAGTPSGTTLTNAGTTCVTIAIAPPYNACQDADGDGALNSVDNCPLIPNTDSAATVPPNVTPGDNQKDSDRDGIGDACDPNPGVIGNGLGYANGVLSFPTTGQYHDYDDTCNAPWSVGGALTPPSACVDPVDSNDDQIYDFFNPGAGLPCTQDHASDSNHDGYSDADQMTPPGAPSCTGAFPAGGGLGQDPLLQCAGRNNLPTATAAQQTAARKALADPDHNGSINILDLSQTSGSFLTSYSSGTDKKAELDYNKDKNVNILDLSTQSGFFLQSVPPC